MRGSGTSVLNIGGFVKGFLRFLVLVTAFGPGRRVGRLCGRGLGGILLMGCDCWRRGEQCSVGLLWVGWMGGLPESVCQEGGRVVWGDGLGAESVEVGVVGGGEGGDGFGGGEGLLAEGFGFAALCGVEDEDAVGEGGDAGVVPERPSQSVWRFTLRGRCPARGLRSSRDHAVSRGQSVRHRLW